MVNLPSPLPGPASADPHMRAAVQDYLLREKDDEVVLAFGRDYFRGARAGATVGGLFTGAWFVSIYFRMKRDQQQADIEVGLRRGQRNPNFSRWVLARGLRTQPMLTVGCCALFATTLFKAAKAFLAHRRCLEFTMDDVEFAMLAQMSRQDPITRELFEKMCSDAGVDVSVDPNRSSRSDGAAASSAGAHEVFIGSSFATVSPSPQRAKTAADAFKSFQEISQKSTTLGGLPGAVAGSCRLPTFWDGVAVGFMGSIMDCHVPMKPLYRYYHMHFGML